MKPETEKSLVTLVRAGIVLCVVVVSAFLFWLFCLNHIDVTDIGITYNSINGEISVQQNPGWYVTSPFVRVANISTLPLRVAIPSEARVINQRMVRFKPEGAIEFVKLQGFSITLGSSLENILLGYAFSGRQYPFLEILEGPQWTTDVKP